MQSIDNPLKWSVLAPGETLEYSNPRKRPVTLEVNTPGVAALYYIPHDLGALEDPIFLARIEGRDQVSFTATGAFSISAEGAPVSIYTADGKEVHQVILDPVIFTKLREMRRRDPHQEYADYLARENMNRMRDEMRQEFAREIEAQRARYEQQNPPAAPVPAAPSTPPAPGAGESESAPASTPPAAVTPVAAPGATGGE